MIFSVDAKNILISIALLAVCIFLFIATYLLNKKVKKPEGCEDISENCEGCQLLSCSHHPSRKTEEEKKEEEEDVN